MTTKFWKPIGSSNQAPQMGLFCTSLQYKAWCPPTAFHRPPTIVVSVLTPVIYFDYSVLFSLSTSYVILTDIISKWGKKNSIGKESCLVWMVLLETLMLRVGGGGGTPRPALLTGAKKSHLGYLISSSYRWAFRISLSLTKFRILQKKWVNWDDLRAINYPELIGNAKLSSDLTM